MKNNPIGVVLAGVLTLLAVCAAMLFVVFVQSSRTLQRLQGEVFVANRNQAALQNLLNEAIEYSHRDPSIEPVLQSMGIRARASAPSTATKPASK